MAIHGSIQVNGETIGRWYAQRVLTAQSGRHTYRWEVWNNGQHVTGDLKHQYDDGALLLVLSILTAARAALAAKAVTVDA